MTSQWKRLLMLFFALAVLVGCARGGDEPYVPLKDRTATSQAQTAIQQPTRTPDRTPTPRSTKPQTAASAGEETAAPGPTPTPIPFVTGKQHFAAPDGSKDGDGSLENPWDLKTALKKEKTIQPGDILWLRGGTYTMPSDNWYLLALLDGTKENPIIIRQYPGERATVDGSIVSRGEHLWYWGFEITNSNPERNAKFDERGLGLNLQGLGNKAINLVIHDVGHPGIGFWEEVGDGGEIYGTIIWGVGRYDVDRSGWDRGSGIYAQNKDGQRFIRETISFRNFATGMKAYTEGGYVNGFVLEGNVAFDNQDRNIFVSGRDHPFQNIQLIGNMTYRAANDGLPSVQIGYENIPQKDVLLKDNYFVSGYSDEGAIFFKLVESVQGSGNTLVSRGNLLTYQPPASATVEWNQNHYYGDESLVSQLRNGGNRMAAIAQGAGVDSASEFTGGLPRSNVIFVRPNFYEPGRGNVIVYNWERRESVEVDLSSILKAGDPYVIVDAQNYFGQPAAEGVYDGQPVSLPMDLTETPPFVGNVSHYANTHTDREFNVFVVLPARP